MTSYELWFSKKPKLSFLEVWGCDAYVKRFQTDKWCLLHNLLLVDVVGPPSAEFCRTATNFPQVDDLRFINPWEG